MEPKTNNQPQKSRKRETSVMRIENERTGKGNRAHSHSDNLDKERDPGFQKKQK